MFKDGIPQNMRLVYVIVNHGMGSRILKEARCCGVGCGTVFYARGTVQNPLLKFLSLYDERKEVVLFATDEEDAKSTMSRLSKTFGFEKPHHGIAYSLPVGVCYEKGCSKEAKGPDDDAPAKQEGKEKHMYKLITTIVNRGNAEDVVEAARGAGARGGTIINGRGTEEEQVAKVFNMEIEPEKEIVLILAKADIAGDIVAAVEEKLNIEQPGEGIIFLQEVCETYGIYEGAAK